MRHDRVELDPYSFWVTRAGAGTPVVLIHGLGGSSDWWRHNVDALAAQHLVAAVDLIGFGRNRLFLRRSRLPLTFVEIAALLARWIESEFSQKVHLAGNSMGGHIALYLAAVRPDLVRSLVLVDTTGIPFELKPGPHLQNLVVPAGALSFARMLTRDLFRSGPASVLLSLARILRDDVRPLLPCITMPVLLVWGERDPLVPLAYAGQLAELIPQARLAVIPRAGHVPMWDNPEDFNREVTAFLREVDAGRALDAAPDAVPRSFSWGLAGWTNGIAHREAGTRRDTVLVHGLGMSSAYFGPFAKALSARGLDPVAPDLPGFGESVDARAMNAVEHAGVLASWADAIGIRSALWIGHSLGCNVVEHLAASRPDLVQHTVSIGPLWSEDRPERLFPLLFVDILRESLPLWPRVIKAYWRCGLRRWFATYHRYRAGLQRVPEEIFAIAGVQDPLPDRDASPGIVEVPGAHACHFSHPEEVAEAVMGGVSRD